MKYLLNGLNQLGYFLKTAFYFSGKDKWHSFEKKYLNY